MKRLSAEAGIPKLYVSRSSFREVYISTKMSMFYMKDWQILVRIILLSYAEICHHSSCKKSLPMEWYLKINLKVFFYVNHQIVQRFVQTSKLTYLTIVFSSGIMFKLKVLSPSDFSKEMKNRNCFQYIQYLLLIFKTCFVKILQILYSIVALLILFLNLIFKLDTFQPYIPFEGLLFYNRI